MSFAVSFILVLASVWIAYLGSSLPRRGTASRLCGSCAACWAAYVSVVMCLLYSAGLVVSALIPLGAVSFWLGLNLVFSSCFLVVPASVVLSSLVNGKRASQQAAEGKATCPAWRRRAAVTFSLLFLGVAAYATIYEPNAVRLNEVSLASPKLPPAAQLRIVHLSDLHISRFGLRERRTLKTIQSLRPDLILLTGDYLATSNALPQAEKFLAGLHAEGGVFAALSEADRRNGLLHGLGDDSGVTFLTNGSVHLALGTFTVRLIGLAEGRDRPPSFPPSVPGEFTFTVVLGHSIWTVRGATEGDLLLAGQTHGGQVGISPLRNLVISRLGGDLNYAGGVYPIANQTLNVSRGLGLEGGDAPRFRFLCPPEVTLMIVRGRA